jgi:hypothetical protein
MMLKRNVVMATVVVCLFVPTGRNTAIEPQDGAHIATGVDSGPQVALHYLTAANVNILHPSVTLMGSPNVTIPYVDATFLDAAAYSSGTFTQGLVGGLVLGTQTVGGIGIDKGIVLATGRVEDREPGAGNVGRYGVDGPNDAEPEDNPSAAENRSVASKVFLVDEEPPPDGLLDLGDVHLALSDDVPRMFTGDRCALEFQVTTAVPGYVQIKVVFASDEWFNWLQLMPGSTEFDFDDTFGVFIHTVGPSEGFEAADNIAVFRDSAYPMVPDMPFSMWDCQEQTQLFTENQAVNDENQGLDPNADYYNHEYNFFTKKFLIESRDVLPPGQYMVKIVIHDVGNDGGAANLYVDSALFIEAGSFKLNTATLRAGDYSGNGTVEQADLDLVLLNWGDPVPPIPAGWVNDLPTGTIDQDELDGVLLNWGNYEFHADFDRDGDVDDDDLAIWTEFNGITKCVLRSMGDADDDGDVDECDLHWYEYERGLRPQPPSQTDNCDGLAMQPLQGESYYCAEADEPIEPIPAPELVVVEEGFNPYLQNRAAAIAEILLIAEARWYTGRSEDSLRIWAGLARVYGKQVVPSWAMALLD